MGRKTNAMENEQTTKTPGTPYQAALARVIGAADEFLEDLETGVEDGTYDDCPANRESITNLKQVIAVVKKGPNIVVCVTGGCVQAVMSDAEAVSVTLRDWDNIEAAELEDGDYSDNAALAAAIASAQQDADPLGEFYNAETDETDWNKAGYPYEVF